MAQSAFQSRSTQCGRANMPDEMLGAYGKNNLEEFYHAMTFKRGWGCNWIWHPGLRNNGLSMRVACVHCPNRGNASQMWETLSGLAGQEIFVIQVSRYTCSCCTKGCHAILQTHAGFERKCCSSLPLPSHLYHVACLEPSSGGQHTTFWQLCRSRL